MRESAQRQTWRRRVGELLDSGLPVKTWCAINEIDFSLMYRWLAIFKDQEPEVLGGYEIAHAGDGHIHWVECVMRAWAGTNSRTGGDGPSPDAGFDVIDLSDGPFDDAGPRGRSTSAHPIIVCAGRTSIHIANGADPELVRAAVEGACAR